MPSSARPIVGMQYVPIEWMNTWESTHGGRKWGWKGANGSPERVILPCGGTDFFALKEETEAASWLSSLALPSAQDVILETQDRVPHRAPCREPASSSACVSASLCVSHE